MQTILFEIKFYNGSKFNVFCANSSQINRFLKFINKNRNKIEYWKDTINGIHSIKDFEKITTNFLN
jgi:hypothetical protein